MAQRTRELALANASLLAKIYEHEEVEAALRESERSFRFLADTMPQIVWTSNPDGALDYYNQRWFDYTGMSFEQTQGWGWGPVLHPDDLQECIDAWTESVKTGGSYQIEYRLSVLQMISIDAPWTRIQYAIVKVKSPSGSGHAPTFTIKSLPRKRFKGRVKS
ncbi:MAG: PAS domain-containing protein [Pyrinomonadaceae bacterium]